MKTLLASLGLIISVPVLLAALGVILPYSIFTAKSKKPQNFQVWITSNGAHTGFLIPLGKTCEDWQKTIDFSTFALPNPKFIHFGWGERDFYRNTPSWNEFKVSEGMRALFRSQHSAMHVTLRYSSYRGVTRTIYLDSGSCNQLSSYIKESFQSNTSGLLKPILDGYGPDDFFYASDLQYSWMFTCNSWVAGGLRKIHLPTPIWSGLAPAILYHLDP